MRLNRLYSLRESSIVRSAGELQLTVRKKEVRHLKIMKKGSIHLNCGNHFIQ